MSCTCKGPCGCGDLPLETGIPCNDTGSCAGEQCAEVFCDQCIVHCQPTIQIALPTGNLFTISQGARLDSILQQFMILIHKIECVGKAINDLRFIAKTSTTITVTWTADPAIEYKLYWKDGNTLSSVNITGLTQYTIINLSPNTQYIISVIHTDTGCSSVNMILSTNS